MTDLRLQNRIGQDDREALEHIARALEGRVLANTGSPVVNGEANGNVPPAAASPTAAPTPGPSAPGSTEAGNGVIPPLDPAGVETLIEAMPAAIGILKGDALTTVNSAFAYAFGYRSPAELIQSGGLDAILPGGVADVRGGAPRERIAGIAALSRSRRRLAVTFILTPLNQDTQLLRLVDPADIEAEAAAPLPEAAAPEPEAAAPDPTTPEPVKPEPSPASGVTPEPRPVTVLRAVTIDPSPAAPAQEEARSEPAHEPQTAPGSQPATPDSTSAEETASGEVGPAPETRPTRETAAQQRRDAAARQLDFLAKVSHEVRTPLNSIIGFAELMLHERFGPIGNSRYKGYAEDIHQSGLYALSLLNDLLDISKIEAGKFELDFTSVDVGEIVEACVASLQPLAKRTRIVLRTSFADDLPLVLADPRRLRQIVLNLLTNAIKFTREGGQVIVSGTMVDGELRLRIHDSGVGMSANDITYAMQPFHQLDTSPRHQSGTGLGLPLTKALTDAIGARLHLTSEPGVGTSADVVFPQERLFRR